MRRIAIVGLGAVTRNIHLPAYASLSDRLTIVGGCDPDPAARAWAERKGVSAVFADPRELLERSRPDLVAVCSPPDLHRAHTELALDAGCHVFCEKPIASTLEDADAIMVASERRGLRVVVNNQFPAMRIHAAARSVIGRPEFGRLLYLHAWHTMRPTAHTEAGWRGTMQRRVGMEFGIHVLDLVRFFFGASPTSIMAHMPRPDRRIAWDAINVLAMDFADGRAASVVLDRLTKGPERYLDFRLDGEHASIHTSIGGQVRAAIGMHTRERRPFVDLRFVGGGRAVLEQASRSRVIASDPQNPFAPATARHLLAFLESLDAGTTPPAGVRDNRESLRLVFAAYRSAEEARAIDVGSFAPPPAG